MLKEESNTRKCNYVIQKGERAGNVCNAKCVGEFKKCYLHRRGPNLRVSLKGSDLKYDNIGEKVKSLIEEKKRIKKTIDEEIDINDKYLYGVLLFLKDPTLEKIKNFEYIPYDNCHKHNALSNKRTYAKKKELLLERKKDNESKLKKLREIREIFNK